MFYRIVPLEPNSIVEQEIFHKSNFEIKCGTIWKIGSLITPIKPKFIKKYYPNDGLSIKNIDGAKISEIYKGKKVIRFSNNTPEEEEEELTEIFYGISKKYSGTYQDIFQDLGWKPISSDFLIYGELEIREVI